MLDKRPFGDYIIRQQTECHLFNARDYNKARRNLMKINARNFNITMAKLCLTARDLQKLGKLSRSTIAKVKHDPTYEPNLKTIGKIAKALNVSVEYLIEGN
jgi:transcriptional regulator with XRE-family HTH domain